MINSRTSSVKNQLLFELYWSMFKKYTFKNVQKYQFDLLVMSNSSLKFFKYLYIFLTC